MSNPYLTASYNTIGGGYITTTTSAFAQANVWPTSAPPHRKKTALEWLREQVDETCAEARVAA